MASTGLYRNDSEFQSQNSRIRTTIQTAFYRNNVVPVKSVSEAYSLARLSPGTIELTGMPVYEPGQQGLPEDANVLLFNDGAVLGRCADARRIVGEPDVDLNPYSAKLREAVYATRYRKMYHAESIIGLDEDFMVKAHLLIPENYENILLSWMLNFQYLNDEYTARYRKSRPLHEGDVYVFSDPEWEHKEHPLGLTFFDPEHNTAALLGMRYFGEHKKGTLTLGWGTAVRKGYAACHGGLKRYNLKNHQKFTLAAFGLSGSGKSTITHAHHDNKYDVTILHDDAFIINAEKKYSIALEPAYFDKTADYPMNCEDNKYILTLQNNGAVAYEDGRIYPVTEDLRNGNGRAVKSKLWSPNRVDRINDPINAIFWLMKDPEIPPVIKLDGASLGAAMGATLATKRTSAERLAPGVDPDALVVEPYANPFRTYPLETDYRRFKKLIEDGVDCYVLNTGSFRGKKIHPHHTLGIVEAIIENRADFRIWDPFDDIRVMPVDGFDTSLDNKEQRKKLTARFNDRIRYIASRNTERGGIDKLPSDALNSLKAVTEKLNA
ncbi:MAG: phosphoenolpyruvate carboxykinase (ATP) [Candidatus Marinimicrobia bacterium]|nr:phosphoenolpyruvate carboxykinase (ATP) [Candidatus Neomarinimicrobiota bacterium]